MEEETPLPINMDPTILEKNMWNQIKLLFYSFISAFL